MFDPGVEDIITSQALLCIVAAVTITLAIALCVCRQKESKLPVETNNFDAAASEPKSKSNGAILRSKRSSNNDKSSDVVVNLPTSNGSARVDSRPRSHDQRALPDIPPRNNDVTQNGAIDLDDIPEEHYDVIPKKPAAGPASVDGAAAAVVDIDQVQNLYEPAPDERVGPSLCDEDDEPDGLYSMVNETPRSKSVVIGGLNVVAHPYESVSNQTYAQIERKRNTISGPPTSSHISENPVNRLSKEWSAMLASAETLGDSYASVNTPPVPSKNFSSVPPPMNDNPLPSTSTALSTLCESSASAELTGGVTNNRNQSISAIDDDENGVQDVIDPVEVLGVINPITGKREPPYSSVTARESLANMRVREAQEMRDLHPTDRTYETVDYDTIVSPSGPVGLLRSRSLQHDTQSLNSDLYAEIASGNNSQRSSMYARVGEVSVPVRINEYDEDIPDPGYSVIRKGGASASNHTSSPSSINDKAATLPLYSVVDKAKKTTNGPNSEVPVNTDDQPSQLYAQVIKTSTKTKPDVVNVNVNVENERPVHNGAMDRNVNGVVAGGMLVGGNMGAVVPVGGASGGARPKTNMVLRGQGQIIARPMVPPEPRPNMPQLVNRPIAHQMRLAAPQRRAHVADGYTTIHDVEQTLDVGADYDTLDDVAPLDQSNNGVDPIDPDYDTVISRPNHVAPIAGARAGSYSVRVGPSGGAWIPREHIYQDINEMDHEPNENMTNNRDHPNRDGLL